MQYHLIRGGCTRFLRRRDGRIMPFWERMARVSLWMAVRGIEACGQAIWPLRYRAFLSARGILRVRRMRSRFSMIFRYGVFSNLKPQVIDRISTERYGSTSLLRSAA